MAQFSGFSPETVEFLWGIRFNNERGWFEEHKEVYQRALYQPMKALGAQVAQALDAQRPDNGLRLKISRIYRDARRLFGRGPYKDHLWFTLHRGESSLGTRPALWFELTPDGWSCGMGFWCAKPAVMARHRARIDTQERPLLALDRKLRGQERFVLEGPEYSRVKTPQNAKLAPWYNKKSLAISHEGPWEELLYQPQLAQRLVEDFTFLMPYLDYFDTLWAQEDGAGQG